MKLSEIFNLLTYGELAQVSMGGAEAGTGITEENQQRMLTHVNLGLTALHKRFLLREARVTLRLVPGQQSYMLHSRYQEGNRRSREEVRYLAATPVFRDDVLRIERVFDGKRELPLNDDNHPLSLRTPTYNTLVLPEGFKGVELTVVYRANHPTIEKGMGLFRPEAVEVELPPTHVEALALFIASRVLNPVGMAQEFHEGNNYAAKYEAECQRLEDLNYRVDQSHSNTRLQRNGWV